MVANPLGISALCWRSRFCHGLAARQHLSLVFSSVAGSDTWKLLPGTSASLWDLPAVHPKAAFAPYGLFLHPYREPMNLSKEMPKPFRLSRPSSTARDPLVCMARGCWLLGVPVPSRGEQGLMWLMCPRRCCAGAAARRAHLPHGLE